MSSPFPIDDLTKPVTVDEVRLSIYSVLAQLGVDTTVWKPGGVVRTIIAATAIMISALSRLTAQIARSGFLETAEGDWLALLARNVYGVTKIDATFASGSALLANSSGGIYVLSDGELQITNLRTGATFVNLGALTIPAVSASVPCVLIATQSGSGSTSLSSDPMAVSSPLPGVSIALVQALIGLDAESDPALRLRCSEKLGALSPNGPPDAYGFVARSATRADGSNVGVTRVRLTNDGLGGVDVYVANAAGGIDPADLPFVDAAIQTQAAPLAVTARTHTAVPVSVTIGAHVYLYNNTGLGDADIQTAAVARLTDFFSSQPIGGNIVSVGGKVYKSAIEAAIGSTPSPVSGLPLPIFRVDVNNPGSDVPLAIDEVAVMVGATITVHQLPPPGTF